MPVRNKVQLITYGDSLGGSLRALDQALETYFPGVFEGGIHILPPFPSSGDRGVAPMTYEAIDPALGSWDDVSRLADRYDLVLDLMVNHISSRSPAFLDYLARGRSSVWADMFLQIDKLWPGGEPVQRDIDLIFTRRPRPYSTYRVGRPGVDQRLWTTFGREDPSEQVDLDVHSAPFRRLVSDAIERFASPGATIMRLDAIGYVIKRPGTSCFFVEPDIYGFLEGINAVASAHGMTLLPEVHARRAIQDRLGEHGYWTYDFILPYTVLEALLIGSAVRLRPYLETRSPRQFTMLDCHDGIPVKPDLDGLYAPADVRRVVQACVDRGGNLSRVFSTAHQDPDGFDVHQVRGTTFSLLDHDEDAYIAARAIQLFVPGVPQVYYVGLLAGENDQEAVTRTGDGRAVNRHNFTMDEIEKAARRDVVRRLVDLIRLRNGHPAFDGEFRVLDSAGSRLHLSWANGADTCTLEVDLVAFRCRVESTRSGGQAESFDL